MADVIETTPTNYVTVVGMFTDRAHAREAIHQMRDRGLQIDDISVVERDADRYDPEYDYSAAEYGYTAYNADELGDETAGGLVLGSLVGGTLGTLAGLGALTIPGIGPVVAAGPLVGALVGGTAGAVTGTLAGALVEAFEVPEEHAEVYSRRLSEGNTMLAVHVAPAQAPDVRDIMRNTNAERFDWPERTTTDASYYWI